MAAGIALPLAAHGAGVSFIVRDIDGGPYFLISPLWLLMAQPLVLLGFVLRETTIFVMGAAWGALLGLGLIFGSIVQLPLALIVPGTGIEEMTPLEILFAHVAAILTGAVGAGLGAWATKK